MICVFLSCGVKKKHKIAKRVIIQPFDLGGLKMVSVFALYNSCKSCGCEGIVIVLKQSGKFYLNA